MENTTENKYKIGSIVNERVHPYRKFTILRYLHRVYYCQLVNNPEHAELMFHEREIMQDAVDKPEKVEKVKKVRKSRKVSK